jgi:putative transposase
MNLQILFKYKSSSGSKFLLCAHLILTTKYRRPVITQRVADMLSVSLQSTASRLSLTIIEIGTDRDHLHVLLSHTPSTALSTIAGRLKGASSRAVRQHRFPEVTSRLWGKHFWSPSYFVVSCGGAPLQTIKRYVHDQGRPLSHP